MAVGGVAVRVTAEALSSGAVRLKRSTAEHILGHAALQEVSTDGPQALVLHPCSPQGFACRVYAQLRNVPTTARQGQSLDATDTPPPPSLHCELCGMGAWLRGQGAVPGVHWVQLWRWAGGALRLRLCDGKPTALPGEEAGAALQQQVIAVTTNLPADSKEMGILDAAAKQAVSARAAATDAASMIVGPAAQAVADAAAPWQLHAPNCKAPCVPARAAWRVPATGDQLGATWLGADRVGSAAGLPPSCDHTGPLPMGQWRTGGGGGSGTVAFGDTRRGCGGDTGSVGNSLSLSSPPMPPPPLLLHLPLLPLSPPPPPPGLPAQQAPQPAAQAAAPPCVGAPRAPAVQMAVGLTSAAEAPEAAAATNDSKVFTDCTHLVGRRHAPWVASHPSPDAVAGGLPAAVRTSRVDQAAPPPGSAHHAHTPHSSLLAGCQRQARAARCHHVCYF